MRRPAHLTPENASAFGSQSVVDAYPFRLPYPDEVFTVLDTLIVGQPRTVLDLGSGTGDLARRMAPRVHRVDAVDLSSAMIARGRTLAGGDAPNLTWIQGRAEDAALAPPYALVTAAESLHWMDWEVLLPRLARLLTAGGSLAIVSRDEHAPPWQSSLMDLIRTFFTFRTYEEYDLVELLEGRGLFQLRGRVSVDVQHTEQSVDDYIRSFHSRASLTPEGLGSDGVRAFDSRLREIVSPWERAGMVTLESAPSVIWGRPLEGRRNR